MDRRQTIKALALGAVAPALLFEKAGDSQLWQPETGFESSWDRWPDMQWAGPAYWANRLQDWYVRDGTVECQVHGRNRTLHCLTHRLGEERKAFQASVAVQQLESQEGAPGEGYVGFRLGAKGPWPDYRSAAVFGTGLDAGITTGGRPFIGEKQGAEAVETDQAVYLLMEAEPQSDGYRVALKVLDESGAQTLASVMAQGIENETLTGNAALVSSFDAEGARESRPSARFSRWAMQGGKVLHDPEATFGPVCFAQYTLDRGTLKLTAQLTPVASIEGNEVVLQVRENGRWHTVDRSSVHPRARIARFRVGDWQRRTDVPYRVRASLPLRDGRQDFFYEGTIAREPLERDELKVAVFSCNCDYGFPDNEVVRHVEKHRPDMAVFLGDQFYESATSDFGIQRFPLSKGYLDFLYKWYMFGWSYRDIFRDIPAAIIPDDHDVYQGNLWGAGGEKAPVEEMGWGGAPEQHGGYEMPPEWVNAVQQAQTSHLPDPYDPTPVEQDIGVYYTDWNYAGVSFAILEDRKFKSGPLDVPEEGPTLLGERQLRFLEEWSTDWSRGAAMKAVLSQTNFCSAHTYPGTGKYGPELDIPPPGEYVEGDVMAKNEDTNGWPKEGRDQALRTIRKCFAFHIAGDQHLASMIHYGIDEFDDAGFVFTGPALNNFWPRRWWPPLDEKVRALSEKPAYTGSFFDRFGNRMTVHAVANPRQTDLNPDILYDRAPGYGIVTFDKAARTTRVECWPRHVDPLERPDGQYLGWPMTIEQQDNYGREAQAWLPTLNVEGIEKPVVEIFNEQTRTLVYALRMAEQTFKPDVFEKGTYTVCITDPATGRSRKRTGVQAAPESESENGITFDFG